METPCIAVIGAGHMGSSLLNGLVKSGYSGGKVWAADPNQKLLQKLAEELHINITLDNVRAIQACDVIIFAIKPQLFAEVAPPLAPLFQKDHKLVISVMAGIQINSMSRIWGQKVSIVRSMPNMPALIGCGASALYAGPSITSEERNLAESILRTLGVVVWVKDENLMNIVTALSGSGPAYFFLIMEALQEAAVSFSLPEEVARLLVLQTALGSARLAMESDFSLPELRKRVTSPGGTTEKGLNVLESMHIREILKKTLEAAKLRSEELATD